MALLPSFRLLFLWLIVLRRLRFAFYYFKFPHYSWQNVNNKHVLNIERKTYPQSMVQLNIWIHRIHRRQHASSPQTMLAWVSTKAQAFAVLCLLSHCCVSDRRISQQDVDGFRRAHLCTGNNRLELSVRFSFPFPFESIRRSKTTADQRYWRT